MTSLLGVLIVLRSTTSAQPNGLAIEVPPRGAGLTDPEGGVEELAVVAGDPSGLPSAVLLSTAVRPPTHFLTVHQRRALADGEFSRTMTRFFSALKWRLCGMERLIVNEWTWGRRHVHAWLIVPDGTTLREVKRAVKQAMDVSCGIARVTCEEVRDPVAVVKYIFKGGREKAELPPAESAPR